MNRFFCGLLSALFLGATVLAAAGCAGMPGFGRNQETEAPKSRPTQQPRQDQAPAQPGTAASSRPASYTPSWPGDAADQRPEPRRQEAQPSEVAPVRPDRPAQPKWTGSTGRGFPARQPVAKPSPPEKRRRVSDAIETKSRTVAAAPAPAARPAVRTNLSTPPLPPNVEPLKSPEPASNSLSAQE